MKPTFIPRQSGYQNLLSYKKAEIVYDITFRFCQRFFAKGDRTIDQMTQAANFAKAARRKSSRTSRTVLSIRPTIFSINQSAASNKTLLKKAAFGKE